MPREYANFTDMKRWLTFIALLALCKMATADEEAKEGEEEEEEEVDPATLPVSMMLLGTITFQMTLWYLVHWPDRDIRMYTWRMLGDTISIFAAVMIFSAFNGIVVIFFEEDLFAAAGFMIFWFLTLQLVTGVMSGAFSAKSDVVSHQQKLLQDQHGISWGHAAIRKLNIRVFSQMIAHITGFAAIRCFGILMQSDYMYGYPGFILPVAFFCLVVLFQGSDFVREHIASRDSVKDEYEEMWDEGTEEAENDVIGLTLSFLGLSCLRYLSTGVLPDPEGEDELEDKDKILYAGLACLAATVAGCVINALTVVGKKSIVPADGGEIQSPIKYRCLNSLGAFGMMLAAWSMLYGFGYILQSTGWEVETIITKVVLALLVSFISCVIIMILDKVADADFTGKMADDILEGLIFSKSLLIGFSWEKAFDKAVESIAESKIQSLGMHPITGKLVLSLATVCIVVPAYRQHIMPKIIRLEQDREEFKKREERLAAQADLPARGYLQVPAEGASPASRSIAPPTVLSANPKAPPRTSGYVAMIQ